MSGTYVITIDTGTTNTRCILWDGERQSVATAKNPTGVRNTAIDGHNGRLKAAVKSCLEELLAKAGITYADVARVIASGMITSNVGLVEIPHIVVPAGKEDLARACKAVTLEDVCPLPIWFIPGVKNSAGPVTFDNFEAMDIMRGEEVESVAIIDRYPRGRSYLIVLPGSHTKFVSVDAEGRMTGCLTTISGELLASITNDTIIADAVGRAFVEPETYDREMVLLGYDTGCKSGIGRSCFSARILSLFTEKDKRRVASYVLGVALQNDIVAIKNSSALKVDPATTVIVGGREPLRTAFVDILAHDGSFAHVEAFDTPDGMPLSALGAYIVADLSRLL